MIDEGYNSFTMRKVAIKLGITVGNLHYYYPNKEVRVNSPEGLCSTCKLYQYLCVQHLEFIRHQPVALSPSSGIMSGFITEYLPLNTPVGPNTP